MIPEAQGAFVGGLWSAINVLLLSRIWKLSGWMFPHDEIWRRVGSTIVLMWAWISLVVAVLAPFSSLNGQTLIAVNLIVLLLVFVFGQTIKNQPHLLTTSVIDHTSATEGFVRNLLLLLLALIFLSEVLPQSMINFPSDWDTLMYHLPLINEWLQTNSLSAPGSPVWYNPGNYELLGLWIVAPFSGDFWIPLAGLIPPILLVSATCSACQEFGMRRTTTVSIVLAIAGTHCVFGQLHSCENDIAVAALFAFAVAFGFRWSRTCSFADALLTACAVGLLCGVKYYALGYTALSSILIVTTMFIRQGVRRATQAGLTLLLGVFLISGHWYLRNYLTTGTPLYPLGYNSQTNALAELRPNTFTSTLLGGWDPTHLSQCIESIWMYGGYVQVLAVCLIPFLLAWMIAGTIIARQEKASRIRLNYLCMLLAVVGSLLVFAVTPFLVDPKDPTRIAAQVRVMRFGQCPLWVLTLCLGLICDDIFRIPTTKYASYSSYLWGLKSIPRLSIFVLSIIQFCLAFVIEASQSIFISVLLLVDLAILWACLHYFGAGTNVLKKARNWSFILIVLIVGSASSYNATRWHHGFSQFYDDFLDVRFFTQIETRELKPKINRIMVLHYRVYPFYGSQRQFRVHRPTLITTRDDFLTALKSFQPDLIFVHPHDPHKYGRYKNAGFWARNELGKSLELLQINNHYDVYALHETDDSQKEDSPKEKNAQVTVTIRGQSEYVKTQ
ncbi:hypothetical protein [Gimesia aquarii]|uniref:Glycosyltransferase RgtA/B/C/D-like domain-containing protein n=1 Tax=Gimesia aquarii TaxID=2527964 RepID=A0A517VZY8_9PLAN|nr:hypothetical protein [Gimesia aquarii]QDT98566.1 hypothetical protein V144x_40730 [Gimesia aquarii]